MLRDRDKVKPHEGWRPWLAWYVIQKCVEGLSLFPWSQDWPHFCSSFYFGWVLKDKVDSKPCHFQKRQFKINSWKHLPVRCLMWFFFFPCFKEVQLSHCWVTCISRRSHLGRGDQSSYETFPSAEVPVSPCLAALGAGFTREERGQAGPSDCQHHWQEKKKAFFLNLGAWNSANSTQKLASARVS